MERQESRQEIKKGTPHKEEDEETNHRRESGKGAGGWTTLSGHLSSCGPSHPFIKCLSLCCISSISINKV